MSTLKGNVLKAIEIERALAQVEFLIVDPNKDYEFKFDYFFEESSPEYDQNDGFIIPRCEYGLLSTSRILGLIGVSIQGLDGRDSYPKDAAWLLFAGQEWYGQNMHKQIETGQVRCLTQSELGVFLKAKLEHCFLAKSMIRCRGDNPTLWDSLKAYCNGH